MTIVNNVVVIATTGLIPIVSDPLQRSLSQKQVVVVPTVVQPLFPVAWQFLS